MFLRLNVATMCGISKVVGICHEIISQENDLNTMVVYWRVQSCLGPPKGSLTCHPMLFATHIDLTKRTIPLLVQSLGQKWYAQKESLTATSMVWLIPHLFQRLSAMFPIDTLQDCHPTLRGDVGQCRPIHVLCTMPKLD